RRLGIRDDRRIGLVNLVDLHFGDVDVDKLLVREQIVAIAESRVLVEGIANREHDIGLDERSPRTRVSAVAEDADGQRMVFIDDALAVERRDERYLETFDKGADLWSCAAADRTESDERQHLLVLREGIGEKLRRRGNIGLVRQNGLHDEAQ